jgi:hypothetical protein
METAGPSSRTGVGSILQIAIALGFMLQPLIAASVRSDVEYQLAALAPIAIFFLFALQVILFIQSRSRALRGISHLRFLRSITVFQRLTSS